MIEQVLELKDTFLARIREAGGRRGWATSIRTLPAAPARRDQCAAGRRQYWVLLLRPAPSASRFRSTNCSATEIVVKNIGQQLARVVGIDGATVLGVMVRSC